jgi:transposase
MDEPLRPAEISPEAWSATPAGVRAFILTLLPLREQVATLSAQLNQHSQNSSKPPSSDPPSAPTRPVKVPRGRPKTKRAQPGHPNQQRALLLPYLCAAVTAYWADELAPLLISPTTP